MRLKNKLIFILLVLFLIPTAQAGKPIWTIVPVSGYPTTVSISPYDTVTIQYLITNQSTKKHTLYMQPIKGVTSSGCTSPLEYQHPCVLSLNIKGAGLTGNIISGPKLCDHDNLNQCYQPSPSDQLNIHLNTSTYTVSSSGDIHAIINPNTVQTVTYNATQKFVVTADTGYKVSRVIKGTCPAGSWSGNTYTTGAIAANCSVAFSTILNTYTINPSSSDGYETISPNDAQTVNYGTTKAFIVTPNSGHSLSSVVGGTCPTGSWSGNIYTTGTITANCSVIFSATLNTYTVSPSSSDGHETLNPNTAQTVNYGTSQAFTVTPDAEYTLSNTVGGTCPAGSWSGNTYTTGTISANCSVVFSATLNTYTVSPSSSDSHETLTPNTTQTVNSGANQIFTVTPDAGYTVLSSVGGSCPTGSWNGNTYTTGAITANCSVIFSASMDVYTVSPSSTDGHETLTPNTPQTVNSGATQAFTLTPDTGYTLSSTVGGTCPAGSWSGNTYTTGIITANCTTTFSATINTYTVSPSSSDGHETLNPNTAQSVNYGTSQAFTVTPDAGYTLSSTVGGTCPAGSWSGNIYTTDTISANCSVIFSATLNTYTVSPSSSDGHETLNPNTAQTVNYGTSQAFILTPDAGYTLSSTVGGTCPAGSWSGSTYTTGTISANCSVVFSATLNTYTVSPSSSDGHETLNPNTPQTVNYGTTKAFIVTPDLGYTLSNTVGGTCPAGSWSGNTYTTGAINADCSVLFNATISTYTVSPSSSDGHETLNPTTPQTVNYGLTQAFTVTANTGYTRSNTVGGTCAAGSWVGNTYTTGTITANCSVTFSATINSYMVTPSSSDGHETINPNIPQTVNYDLTQAFTVTADIGYTRSNTVGGTCAAGSWVGNTYTTGAITANCSVTFSATLNSYTVTPGGDGFETFLPNTAQTVNYGLTQAFAVTANTGYMQSNVVGGTCPAGSWVGNTYTTGTITANCSVAFNAVPGPATATNVYSSLNPSATGAAVVLTAYISSADNTNPTGTVTFNANAVAIPGCSAVSVSTNSATCSTSSLANGSPVVITAAYTPTAASRFQSNTSAGFNQYVAASVSGTIPANPLNVTAVPGNAKVTVNWLPPENTGGQAITGYQVNYGVTGVLPYNTAGCNTAGALTCNVNGLTNDTAYTFVVTATNASGSGVLSASSSATPANGLVVSPSILTLSGLGSGKMRTMVVTNTSISPITGLSVSVPTPALPGAASSNTLFSNACVNLTSLAAGASCTITINPGTSATSSSACSGAGTTPTPSTFVITSSSAPLSANDPRQ